MLEKQEILRLVGVQVRDTGNAYIYEFDLEIPVAQFPLEARDLIEEEINTRCGGLIYASDTSYNSYWRKIVGLMISKATPISVVERLFKVLSDADMNIKIMMEKYAGDDNTELVLEAHQKIIKERKGFNYNIEAELASFDNTRPEGKLKN